MKIMCTLGAVLFFCINLYSQATESASQKPMQDTAYPFPVKRMLLNDTLEIAYMDEGTGAQTLLFIHGLGSYAPAWNKNLAALRSDYRCIALDLPNYGLSQKGDFPATMSYFATTIEGFVKALNLQNIILVGHSMGAQIALQVALNQKVPVGKLVLLAPAGFETFTEGEVQWFGQMFNPLILKAMPTEQIRKNFDLNFYGNTLPEDAQFMYEDRLDLMEQVEDYNLYCNMIPKCVMGMLNEPVFNRLVQIKQPTLVLFGKEDLLIPNRYLHPDQSPESVAKAGTAQLPKGELQLLSPCGHFIQWDCAAEVNGAIKVFLQK